MIQRVQTLLLLEVLFLAASLLFVPSLFVITNGTNTPVSFLPINNEIAQSGLAHFAALGLDLIAALIALITIFIFKKRELQVKLCFVLVFIFTVLLLMVAFCPLVNNADKLEIRKNSFAFIILIISIVSSFIASRFIKRDIELIKSADRIR
jgi:hypothetical protein